MKYESSLLSCFWIKFPLSNHATLSSSASAYAHTAGPPSLGPGLGTLPQTNCILLLRSQAICVKNGIDHVSLHEHTRTQSSPRRRHIARLSAQTSLIHWN